MSLFSVSDPYVSTYDTFRAGMGRLLESWGGSKKNRVSKYLVLVHRHNVRASLLSLGNIA